MTILIFLLILGTLVFVHELGHFITAKIAGVKVEEFGLGFPPRIGGIRRGETMYTINAIPLGGFVKMTGEEDPSAPRSLASKRPRTRLLILSAGVIMNALLPLVLFSVSFMVPQHIDVGDVTVTQIAQGSPAQESGLQVGDVIRTLDGVKIRNAGDLFYQENLRLGSPVTFGVERNGSIQDIVLTPRWKYPSGQGPIGIPSDLNNVSQISQSDPFWRAIPKGAGTYRETIVLTRNEVESWFKGRAPQVSGPIGVADVTGHVAKAGVSPLLYFAAILSINLAIINILPVPGLDGGRIFFVVLEIIRKGKRVSPRKEGLVHLIGFAILIMFIIVVSYFDLARLVGK